MRFSCKKLIALTLFLTLAFSCGGDDEASKTSVKYIVTSTANIFTSVKYRNANNTLIEAVGEIPGIEWDRSINVRIPFIARIEAVVNNTTSSSQDYDLAIYVDGELKEYSVSTIAPGDSETLSAEYELN